MIEPALVPVPPRIISPMTGESVRLDEAVLDRLTTLKRGVITVAGGLASY